MPPSAQTGYLGGTAQLTVIAQGFPAPSFQWRAGAVGSGIYTNLPNGAGDSHGTLNNLTLQNLKLANMADYVVVVSNSSGSVTSSIPATLTVLPTSDFPAMLVHRYSFQDHGGQHDVCRLGRRYQLEWHTARNRSPDWLQPPVGRLDRLLRIVARQYHEQLHPSDGGILGRYWGGQPALDAGLFLRQFGRSQQDFRS